MALTYETLTDEYNYKGDTHDVEDFNFRIFDRIGISHKYISGESSTKFHVENEAYYRSLFTFFDVRDRFKVNSPTIELAAITTEVVSEQSYTLTSFTVNFNIGDVFTIDSELTTIYDNVKISKNDVVVEKFTKFNEDVDIAGGLNITSGSDAIDVGATLTSLLDAVDKIDSMKDTMTEFEDKMQVLSDKVDDSTEIDNLKNTIAELEAKVQQLSDIVNNL